jgi:hypothetical protein
MPHAQHHDASWQAHHDINDVMLVTALIPDTFSVGWGARCPQYTLTCKSARRARRETAYAASGASSIGSTIEGSSFGSPWMWTLVSGTTKVAARRTGMRRPERPLWPPSLRASDFRLGFACRKQLDEHTGDLGLWLSR